MIWNKIAPSFSDEVLVMLDNIAKSIMQLNKKGNWGLLGGNGGAVLFFHHYIKLCDNNIYSNYLEELINNLIKDVYNTRTLGVCNGLTGICWLLRFLYKNGYLACDDINQILEYPERCLLSEMYRTDADTDYLHGTLGIANYFAISNSPFSEEAVDLFLDKLWTKKITKQETYAWLTQTYVNYKSVGFVHNLGLSHGMAGILAYLKNVLTNKNITKNKTRAEDLMNGLINFYLVNRNLFNTNSIFPKWIDPSNTNYYIENRPSWCYGDPGILNALYNSIIICNPCQETIGLIMDDLDLTSKKLLSMNSSVVYEVNFCHGTSGLMHMYNNFFQKIGNEIFKETSLRMLSITLDRYKFENGKYAGFVLPDSNEYANPISFLSGLSGIGLSSMAMISEFNPEWNNLLLL